MSDPRDLTGVWYGRYVSRSDAQDNSFIAVLEEEGGGFTGTITEPDQGGAGAGGIRRASVSGRRDGTSVQFLKQYQGSGGWFHAVRYAGRVDDEGTEVTGSWKVDWISGSFTMQREKFAIEVFEAEREEELTLR